MTSLTRYINTYFNTNNTEFEEVIGQIVKNKNMNDLKTIITILKREPIEYKIDLSLGVDTERNIEVYTTLYHYKPLTTAEEKQLKEDLEKQITSTNIKLEIKEISEENFRLVRSAPLYNKGVTGTWK